MTYQIAMLLLPAMQVSLCIKSLWVWPNREHHILHTSVSY